MKKPNLFLYITLGFLVKIFSILKGQKIVEKTNIKGPAICLSNHTSFYDFIYTTAALYPKRVSYLAASKMFYEKSTRPFLKLARAIPKSLMQADPAATLKAFKLLKKKSILSIFPEGQISPSGETLRPAFSIAKFLKKANVDVYIIVNPPWTKKTFKGRIETRKFLLISKEDLVKLSLDEIYHKVCEGLSFKPSDFIEQKGYTYRMNDLSGLENVIYECPKCMHEGLIAQKDRLTCPKCSLELKIDQKGLLEHKAINTWFHMQEERVRNRVIQDQSYHLDGSVKLMSFRGSNLVEVGSGKLNLYPTYYQYDGTVDGEIQTLTFNVESTPTLPSDIGRNVQIYEGYQIYQFEFDKPWLPTKFVHVGEFYYEKNKNNSLNDII